MISMDTNLTEIIFLLDRSGSMAGLEDDTIGGFNAFIDKQKRLKGKTIVTTVLFDHEYEILWNGVDANEIKLTDKEYYVRGSTALLDAVGKTIVDVNRRLAKANDDERPDQIIFIITTDGMENSSHEFTYKKIKQLIKHQQEKYDWKFIFLGANIDTGKEADNIGIHKNNAYNFEASESGVQYMYDIVHGSVSEMRKDYRKK